MVLMEAKRINIHINTQLGLTVPHGKHILVENQAVENGNYSNSNYYHPQPIGPATGNVQEIPNTASFTSSSTSGTANAAQDYSGYTPYQTSSDKL
ncbi:hypothetical protein ARALYDRAFT_905912 [Arabidopsis lyrata subsp. lyrata]|uniref:Uncharacterized protein n=1 Tax=Arabidopsis lyrata subsp. lyrata TaxID=81972 RepID=D7LN78_ARALL|nr:hypothetical protein ARALYDRAFT_905912 [Arabidopsis lyrata subsp. lyrata]